MPQIHIDFPKNDDVVDVGQIWRDYNDLNRRGLVVFLDDTSAEIRAAVLPKGMESGRAAVILRFQLPNRRIAVLSTSLRAIWSMAVAIASRYGEDFMQVQPSNDVILQLKMANAELIQQLADAKRRLGEPNTIDMTRADAAWEQFARERKEKQTP